MLILYWRFRNLWSVLYSIFIKTFIMSKNTKWKDCHFTEKASVGVCSCVWDRPITWKLALHLNHYHYLKKIWILKNHPKYTLQPGKKMCTHWSNSIFRECQSMLERIHIVTVKYVMYITMENGMEVHPLTVRCGGSK